MATDSLIPEWLEEFEREENEVEGTAEQVEDIEPVDLKPDQQPNVMLPGVMTPQDAQTVGQAAQSNVNLPGVMAPQDVQTVRQGAVPGVPPQPQQDLGMAPGAMPQQQEPIPEPKITDFDKGLTPEEERELELLMEMEARRQMQNLSPSESEMEQAAQGGDDVILPDTQTLGGN